MSLKACNDAVIDPNQVSPRVVGYRHPVFDAGKAEALQSFQATGVSGGENAAPGPVGCQACIGR